MIDLLIDELLKKIDDMLTVIDPTSGVYYGWLWLMTLAVLYNLFFIIVRCVYKYQLHLNYPSVWLTADYLSDAIYVVDMLLRAHTGHSYTHIIHCVSKDAPTLKRYSSEL